MATKIGSAIEALDAPEVNSPDKERVSVRFAGLRSGDVWSNTITPSASDTVEERDTALNRYVVYARSHGVNLAPRAEESRHYHEIKTLLAVPHTLATATPDLYVRPDELGEGVVAGTAAVNVYLRPDEGEAIVASFEMPSERRSFYAIPRLIDAQSAYGLTRSPSPVHQYEVNVDPVTQYRAVRGAAREARGDALADLRRRLDAAAAEFLRRSPREVAGHLTDELGFGQLVVAKAVGVTPTAVRKWRRGEPAKTDHRRKLAQLAAFGSILGEVGVHDPGGWIDIPISAESSLTALDLFVAGRADLGVLAGGRLSDPHETLELFDPDWRSNAPTDAHHRLLRLSDGSEVIVPRRSEGAEGD